jgi:hypothetical protein
MSANGTSWGLESRPALSTRPLQYRNAAVSGGVKVSFTRGVQPMFEQTWELKPLSVRNTVNGLKWIAGLVAYKSPWARPGTRPGSGASPAPMSPTRTRARARRSR